MPEAYVFLKLLEEYRSLAKADSPKSHLARCGVNE